MKGIIPESIHVLLKKISEEGRGGNKYCSKATTCEVQERAKEDFTQRKHCWILLRFVLPSSTKAEKLHQVEEVTKGPYRRKAEEEEENIGKGEKHKL
mmetsp:Transcript_58938/g.67137  ORF Transcript_58938/g.67137 Transcript_58938/m.67137 type:complete len:97 (-) Transcript_58938:38-328(-)